MPRILSFRLLGLWFAVAVDYDDHPNHLRFGLSERSARLRTCRAI